VALSGHITEGYFRPRPDLFRCFFKLGMALLRGY